jgi:alkylation response protein AidB-like acyl-CoA dehydrogenase
MRFKPDDEHAAFIRDADRSLSRSMDFVAARHAWESELGYDRATWRAMIDAGWAGISLSDEVGGAGDFQAHAQLFHILGVRSVPSPLLAGVMAGHLLEGVATQAASALIEEIVSGKRVIGVAFGDSRDPVRLTPTCAGGAQLHGAKWMLPAGGLCDAYIVTAATEQGTALVVVEDGVTCSVTDMPSISRIGEDRLARVEVDGRFVGSDHIIAPGSAANDAHVARALLVGQAFASCTLAGLARRALTLATDYALQREAFGHPIGYYQAIKHKLADMAMQVEGAELLSQRAAWALGTPGDPADAVAMANLWCTRAAKEVTAHGIQVFGSAGLLDESEIAVLYRRAKAAEMRFGGPRGHLRIILGALRSGTREPGQNTREAR